MAIQTLTLNVNAQPSAEDRAFLYLSQNENGRDIRFRVLGDALPSGCTATLSGVKPDGNVWSKAGTVTNNFVVVEEDVQMTAVAGRWDAQLDIVNGSKNIVTALIRIKVEAAAVEAGAVPSDTQLEGYVEQCKQYAETAKDEAYGSPLTAATAAAMTDQRRVYVYTGSETGYTAGHWYYYNGSAWTDGGVYNAVAVDTDTTLSVSGKAADAKKTGDEISQIKEDLSDIQVIDNISDMATVTSDKVLILHNDSDYGDGGPCWFEYLDYATEGGYARKDGGKMYPMLDQGPLLTSDPPVEKMMGLISSYVENDNLVYGNDHTLFDSDTTNEIDCSSFVSAILHGISYDSSKYTTGSSTRRVAKVASYSPLAGSIFGHLKSRYMAQFFAERKWLHSMPTTYQMRNVLQFGDILFSWDGTETAKNRYLEIGHVAFVLGIINNTYVIVAQCGGYPGEIGEVTIKNNSNTVGKISTIALSSANISNYFRAFARIPYINEHDLTFTGNRIKPILIPNIWVDGSRSGEISSSNVCATSYGYISVVPGSTLTFTGKTVHNGNNLSAIVAEFDGKFNYLSKTNFTSNPKTLSSSTRYIRLCYSHPEGSGIPMLLDDCDQFEATIS